MSKAEKSDLWMLILDILWRVHVTSFSYITVFSTKSIKRKDIFSAVPLSYNVFVTKKKFESSSWLLLIGQHHLRHLTWKCCISLKKSLYITLNSCVVNTVWTYNKALHDPSKALDYSNSLHLFISALHRSILQATHNFEAENTMTIKVQVYYKFATD